MSNICTPAIGYAEPYRIGHDPIGACLKIGTFSRGALCVSRKLSTESVHIVVDKWLWSMRKALSGKAFVKLPLNPSAGNRDSDIFGKAYLLPGGTVSNQAAPCWAIAGCARA
jgi:hypothetical protein